MSKIFALVGIITMGVGIAMMFNAGMQPNASAQSDTDGALAMGTLIILHDDCYERVPGGDAVSPGVIRLAPRGSEVCGWNPTPIPTATPEPKPDATCLSEWTGEPWLNHYVGEWPNGYFDAEFGGLTCPTPDTYCYQWVDLTQPGDIWQRWEWVRWEPGDGGVSDENPIICGVEE